MYEYEPFEVFHMNRADIDNCPEYGFGEPGYYWWPRLRGFWLEDPRGPYETAEEAVADARRH